MKGPQSSSAVEHSPPVCSSQIPSQEARSVCADAGLGLFLLAPCLGLTLPFDPLELLSVLFSFFTLDSSLFPRDS